MRLQVAQVILEFRLLTWLITSFHTSVAKKKKQKKNVSKFLTNTRSSASDEALRLTPPQEMGLEKSLEWINDDELVEVTPKSIRIRKAILDKHDRKKAMRRSQQ